MTKVVRKEVFVHGAQHGGQNRWFKPGEVLPNWAEALVKNPKVFAEVSEAVDLQTAHEESVEPIAEAPIDYDSMYKSSLVQLLEERGLNTEGNKTVLISRLEDHDAANS